MKKSIVIFVACMLACSLLAGCSGAANISTSAASSSAETEPTTAVAEEESVSVAATDEADAAETQAGEEESEAAAATDGADAAFETQAGEKEADKDYSDYIGTWSESLQKGGSRSVVIRSVDGNTVSFTVSTVYPNATRLVGSNEISGEIVNGAVDFSYSDSFNNTGVGTLLFCDGYVHVTVTSNYDGSGAYLNFDSDLKEHSDYTGPAIY